MDIGAEVVSIELILVLIETSAGTVNIELIPLDCTAGITRIKFYPGYIRGYPQRMRSYR